MDKGRRTKERLSLSTHTGLAEGPLRAARPSGMVKTVLALGLVVMLTGCATIHDMARSLGLERQQKAQIPQFHLDRFKSVLVALPPDAETPSVRYVGSGRVVALAVAEAFAGRGVKVEVAETPLTRDEAVAFATRKHAGYVVLPVITHWEQRNAWLGVPSRLALWVSVIEAGTGRLIKDEPVKSHSFEPLSFTVEGPEQLLQKPLAHYVSNLY